MNLTNHIGKKLLKIFVTGFFVGSALIVFIIWLLEVVNEELHFVISRSPFGIFLSWLIYYIYVIPLQLLLKFQTPESVGIVVFCIWNGLLFVVIFFGWIGIRRLISQYVLQTNKTK